MNWIKVNSTVGYDMVLCIAEIKNNATGEVRDYPTTERLNNDEEFPSVFSWEENNYSCDCNRSLFFNDNDVSTTYDAIDECSDGRFSVNLKNKADGKVYYREF
jgi:hypothetical protein